MTTSFKAVAGASIKSGMVVYQREDGLIYPLRPAGYWRRLLQWIGLVRPRRPAGICLLERGRGEGVEVMWSDVGHARRRLGMRGGGLPLYEVELVGGPGDGCKSICSHDTVYWFHELYVRGLDDRYYWQPAAGGNN